MNIVLLQIDGLPVLGIYFDGELALSGTDANPDVLLKLDLPYSIVTRSADWFDLQNNVLPTTLAPMSAELERRRTALVASIGNLTKQQAILDQTLTDQQAELAEIEKQIAALGSEQAVVAAIK